MTTTTQDAFHPLRGHVFDGSTIKMRDGAVWIIKSDMRGWRLRREDGSDVIPPTTNAYALAAAIASY